MKISEESARRLEESLSFVAEQVDALVLYLIDHLRATPEVGQLFSSESPDSLRLGLPEALAMIVMNCRQPETLVGPLDDLGRRHAHYGVEPIHFRGFADALVKAIRQIHGPDMTPELEKDWRDLVDMAAMLMVDGLQIEQDLLQTLDGPA